jgi:regulator of protease activity HflC (stomatin/prohibitin superfamily)
MNDFLAGTVATVIIVGAIIGGIIGVVWVIQPVRVMVAEYSVKTAELHGSAELKRAEQNRQILVEQARAERDAAQLTADAIAIVGQAAKDFPEYRQQEFIRAFGEAVKDHAVNTVIYVPTEGNIPVTEAGRFSPIAAPAGN